MDAKELMAILNDWQEGKDDFTVTSLKLISLGCSAPEAMTLMKEYPQKAKEQTS